MPTRRERRRWCGVGAFAKMPGLPVSSHASQALVLANEPTPVGALARVRDASVSQPSTTLQDPRSGERAYQRAVPAFDCTVTAEGTADESHTSEFGTPQRIAPEGFPLTHLVCLGWQKVGWQKREPGFLPPMFLPNVWPCDSPLSHSVNAEFGYSRIT